jgi:hypothetical protein
MRLDDERRGRPLGALLALVLLSGLAAGRPAGADQVVLVNGGLLSGSLELTELVLQTREGPVRLERQQVQRAVLGTATGDAVLLRSGRTVVGRIDQARYAIRLASGQTVTAARAHVAALTLQ